MHLSRRRGLISRANHSLRPGDGKRYPYLVSLLTEFLVNQRRQFSAYGKQSFSRTLWKYWHLKQLPCRTAIFAMDWLPSEDDQQKDNKSEDRKRSNGVSSKPLKNKERPEEWEKDR